MAKFAYPEIWKRSFLLEIVRTDTSEIFTFSLPPENIEVVYPQRISETKTFGGLFVDDYGSDAAKITLSGNTGNSEIRQIYRGSQGNLELSGKDEIYYIRDHIVRYKEGNDNYGDTKLYLYNLSTITEEDVTARNYKTAVDSWEVVLKDFKITQTKERPFLYAYSVEFIGLRILGREKESSQTSQTSTSDPVQSLGDASATLAPLADTEDTMMIGTGMVLEDDMSELYNIASDYLPDDYYPNLPVEERIRLGIMDNKIPASVVGQYGAVA